MQTQTPPNKRIDGLDLARAIAIFGMILVNYVYTMHLGYQGTGEPTWISWLPALIEGRAAPLFIILAGIGVSLMTKKALVTHDAALLGIRRRTLLRRSLFLFIVGFLHSWIWDPDIIHFYAFYITIGSLFLLASNRSLLVAAGISALIFPLLYALFDYRVGWDFSTLTYEDLWSLEGSVRHIFYNGFHPVFPWIAFFFIGMWLGRGVLFEARGRRKILVGALILVVIVHGTAAITQHYAAEDLTVAALATVLAIESLPPTPLYVLSASASAIIVIVLSLLLAEQVGDALWLRLLNTTGQMSLSIYLAHILVGLWIAESLGMLYRQPLAIALGYAVLFFLTSITLANLWRLQCRHGPLEWLMRKLG